MATYASSTYTYDDNLVSDLHKDAYGFRPTEGFWIRWENSSEAQKQEEWDYLCKTLDRELEYEARAKEVAVAEFEERVAGLLEVGAADRAQAIRWIAQGLGIKEDAPWPVAEELEYELGLPYGYLPRT